MNAAVIFVSGSGRCSVSCRPGTEWARSTQKCASPSRGVAGTHTSVRAPTSIRPETCSDVPRNKSNLTAKHGSRYRSHGHIRGLSIDPMRQNKSPRLLHACCPQPKPHHQHPRARGCAAVQVRSGAHAVPRTRGRAAAEAAPLPQRRELGGDLGVAAHVGLQRHDLTNLPQEGRSRFKPKALAKPDFGYMREDHAEPEEEIRNCAFSHARDSYSP